MRGAAALALLLAGCVPPLDTASAPCPCDDAHECCPTAPRDQCVPRGHLEQCRGIAGCALPDGTPPSLAIAQGVPDSTVAQPLDAAGTIPLYYGYQGGFHVYLQLLVERFYPNDVRVTRRLLDPATGSELRAQTDVLDFVCDAGSWVLLEGQRTYVCPGEVPGEAPLHDRGLTLDVRLASERTGDAIERAFPLHPTCPLDAHHDFCANSAQGCGTGP